MRARGFVRRWLEDALGLSDLVERLELLEGLELEAWVTDLGEQVGRFESSVNLGEMSEQSAGLEVRVENCETEGALDRVRIEELEARVETVAATVRGVLDLLEANLSGVRHD